MGNVREFELKPLEIKTEKTLKDIQKMFVVLLCMMQTMLMLQFFYGMVSVFGTRVSLLRALELLVDVFSSRTIKGVTHCIIGFAYFVVLFFIVKNFIYSFKYVSDVFSGDRNQKTLDSMVCLLDMSQKGFYAIVAFLVLCRVLTTFRFNKELLFIIIFSGVVSLLAKAMIMLWESREVLTSLIKTAYNVLFYCGVFIFTVLVCKVQISHFFMAIKYILRLLEHSGELPYEMVLNTVNGIIVTPIFYILLQIFAIKIINNTIFVIRCDDYESKRNVNTALIISGVFLAVNLVVSIYCADIITSEVIFTAKPQMLLFLCAMALFLTFYFPDFICSGVESKDKSRAKTTLPDENVSWESKVPANRGATTAAINARLYKHVPKLKRAYFEERLKIADKDCLNRLLAVKLKSITAAMLFVLFLDSFGVARFYARDMVYGVVKIFLSALMVALLACRFPIGYLVALVKLIWNLIDFLIILKKVRAINEERIIAACSNEQ